MNHPGTNETGGRSNRLPTDYNEGARTSGPPPRPRS